jgi:hypothetical protein
VKFGKTYIMMNAAMIAAVKEGIYNSIATLYTCLDFMDKVNVG